MGGGLMQLVAYGAQDVYLSGNPQITFFKVVYRRHTNFSVEPIQQTWNGAADFNRTVTCNINRNGDLITNMYVVVKLKEHAKDGREWGFVNKLGHAIIENVKIEIGGSKIDEQYGDWLNIWYELTHKTGQERGYAKMIGDVPELTNISSDTIKEYQLYVPLQFWFNRNNGLALPLIALQYHDVRITLQFRNALQCINYVGTVAPTLPQMSDSYLLIDYVYLDSEERKRFAQASHEYLIEQLQFAGSEQIQGSASKYRLTFNHPSKYLIWAHRLGKYTNTSNKWLAYASDGNWNDARDKFAKILATVCSKNFNVEDTVVDGVTTSTYVTFVSDGVQAGELCDFVPADLATVLPQLFIDPLLARSLLSKINVKFIAQAPIVGDVGTVGNAADPRILDNMIVTKNNLSISDISNACVLSNLTEPALSFVRQFVYSISNSFNYGHNIDGSDNVCTTAKLQLNGHDRFQTRDGNYFNYVQPAQHFSNTPADGINVYSFALKAEDHQPTGTCNFSRIDNASLHVDVNSSLSINNSTNNIYIYTQNYNVLRVMSGMAGTAYSN
jgi:hypothetical protein